MLWPKWYELARAETGTHEGPGVADNPRVIQYYKDAGHPEIKHDAVAWCAAFVGAMLERAGIKPSGSLMARSYLSWGKKLEEPMMGCIVVLSLDNSPIHGHVAFFDHMMPRAFAPRVMLLGGNQADSVCFRSFPKKSVLGYRWPSED